MIEIIEKPDIRDSDTDDKDVIHFIIGSTEYVNGIWSGGRRICDGQPSVAWMLATSVEHALQELTCETCKVKLGSYFGYDSGNVK